ncbi:keratin 15, gene 1 S homeolog [Xenopus laevis]|uniref:Keratin 15, gene 1 S homeolog n=1 Tax=Xenopus laevis TaxID=8355 RepID=Q566F9_XENLA|nr:keratin 15, gene 1 S homeolog [Xenopus laevis]AAH93567.1 MGC84388 protein [Xenopus laevis]
MSFSSSRVGSNISSRLSTGVYGVPSGLQGGYGGSGISKSTVRLTSSALGSGFGDTTSFGGTGASSFSTTFASTNADGLLSGNEKSTMQNLNDRLSNYLDKVRCLEESNADLEKKIFGWHEKQGSVTVHEQNYSPYYSTIDELRQKIHEAFIDKNRIFLEADNARLAAEDFKLKYENEHLMRLSVEGDINGLRKHLDEMTLSRTDLELQIENLKEELTYMKKNHEEEMSTMGQQMTGSVNVEMDAAPANDLIKVLGDMREHYEYLVAKNQRDLEVWYLSQSETLQKEVVSGTEQVQTTNTEITDLRRSVQGLEAELQSQYTKKAALEAAVGDTEGRYATQLSHIQSIIGGIEAQLYDLRNELEHQNQEHKSLLAIKSHLEAEISTYHKLLEGQQFSIGDSKKGGVGDASSTTTTTKITTVVKEEVSSGQKQN